MENPCKNCLVKPICTTCCSKLNKFVDTDIDIKSYPTIKFWIINYEVRPRVIETYPQFRRK